VVTFQLYAREAYADLVRLLQQEIGGVSVPRDGAALVASREVEVAIRRIREQFEADPGFAARIHDRVGSTPGGSERLLPLVELYHPR
jgi:hypothetical protein